MLVDNEKNFENSYKECEFAITVLNFIFLLQHIE